MLVSGVLLSTAGFIVSPVGEISDSVLWLFSQCLLYAGAALGIDAFVDHKIEKERDWWNTASSRRVGTLCYLSVSSQSVRHPHRLVCGLYHNAVDCVSLMYPRPQHYSTIKQKTSETMKEQKKCAWKENKLFEVVNDMLMDTHAKIFHSAMRASENDRSTVIGNLTLRLCVTV